MFKPGTTSPCIGEIRLGYVAQSDENNTHKYIGIHPYLIVSNDTYNKFSGQSECITFTSKRFHRESPSHVNFIVGEVEGLQKPSTLIVESRDTIRNENLSEPIGRFSDENWEKIMPAIVAQNPFIQKFMCCTAAI